MGRPVLRAFAFVLGTGDRNKYLLSKIYFIFIKAIEPPSINGEILTLAKNCNELLLLYGSMKARTNFIIPINKALIFLFRPEYAREHDDSADEDDYKPDVKEIFTASRKTREREKRDRETERF